MAEIDLALEYNGNGDLVIIDGDLSVVAGVPHIAQQAVLLLHTLQGQAPFDPDHGIPWLSAGMQDKGVAENVVNSAVEGINDVISSNLTAADANFVRTMTGDISTVWGVVTNDG